MTDGEEMKELTYQIKLRCSVEEIRERKYIHFVDLC